MDKSLQILQLLSEVDKLREEIKDLKRSLEFQKLCTSAAFSLSDTWRTLYLTLKSNK